MKRIYLVAEGKTDQIVISELIDTWLQGEDFMLRLIQPPSSEFADLNGTLSEGWKGVLAWCEGKRRVGPVGRDEAFALADGLIIHMDADVASDPDFKTPAFAGSQQPARHACDWIREHLTEALGGHHPNMVLCVPAQDLEAWILCALHPEVADQHAPIECRQEPGALLVQRPPHRLVRREGNRLRKQCENYKNSLPAIIEGWPDCLSRCPEAARFETDAKQVLGVTG